MLTKRIIPCLDVKNGYVVKGIKFKNHEIVGSILDLASKYNEEGADELVFYDIGASTYDGIVSKEWVKQIAELINIPFCVAGGIKNLIDARDILNNGADKISINSPALANPNLIQELANEFGSQCVVVGIDSRYTDNKYIVSTNKLHSLQDFIVNCLNFIEINFEIVNDKNSTSFIDKKNGKVFLTSEKSKYRDVDLYGIQGDNSKIKKDIGWFPTLTLDEICSKMISYDIKKSEKNN